MELAVLGATGVISIVMSIITAIASVIGLGLSSYGVYSLLTEKGVMAEIPAVEDIVATIANSI